MAEAKPAVLVPRRRRAEIGGLEIDVTEAERHSMRAEATDKPVEEGADVSEHVRQRPDEVTLEIVWSDVPMDQQLAEAGRARRLWRELRSLKEDGEPIDVLTSLRSYREVVITRVDTRKDADTGFTIPSSISIKDVERAGVETVDVPLEEIDPELAAGAASEQNEGRRTSEEEPEDEESEDGEEEETGSSFLHSLLYE